MKTSDIKFTIKSLNTQKFILTEQRNHFQSLSDFYKIEAEKSNKRILDIIDKVQQLSETIEEILYSNKEGDKS